MSIALYRKYRSGTFAELVGQEHVAATLRNEVRAGRLAHAYLFAGIRGTGKTSTARILARAVNCLDLQDGEPCNRCTACVEILGGGAVDVLEIDAASNRGIDEMRDLREKVKFLPASLRVKVYIIDEAHMLTPEAWNAFLKTLEEPPPHVLFVLATTEPHKVPDTVRSRVQRFDFRRVDREAIARHLAWVVDREGVVVAPEALDLLARAGGGSVRDSLSLLDQALAVGERPVGLTTVRRALGLADPATMRNLMTALAAGDAAGALRAAGGAFDAGADARHVLREAARLARSAEMVAVGYAEGAEMLDEDAALCEELAVAARPGLWVEALDRLGEAEINLRQPVDARLQVELCLLRVARSATGAGPVPVAGEGDGAGLEALARRVAVLEAALRASGASGPPGARTEAERRALAQAMEPAPPSAAGGRDPRPVGDGRTAGAGRVELEPMGGAVPATSAPAGAAVSAAAPATSARAEAAPAAVPSTAGDAGDTAMTVDELSARSARSAGPAGAAGDEVGPPLEHATVAAPGDVDAWVARWPLVIEAVNRRDPMLAGVLRSCHPVAGGPDHLTIGAPYGFHLERLQDKVKARLLSDAVSELVGGGCTVDAVFSGEPQPQPPAASAPRAAVGTAASPAGEIDPTRAALAAFPGSRMTGTRLRDAAHEGPGRPGPA